jgi:arylsulfatase
VLEAVGDDAASREAVNNDPNIPNRPGRSLLSSLRNDQAASEDKVATWWFHEGNRAIRRGNWKLVSAQNDPWELYDLSADRNETRNLAESNPDMVRQLSQAWQQQVQEFKEQAGKDYGDESK